MGKGIRVAFCWGHVRRDFDRIYKGYPRFRVWAEAWLARINDLFHLNKSRLEMQLNSPGFRVRDQVLRNALDAMVGQREREIADCTLAPKQQAPLLSMRNHWDGLTIFVDHPEIPMDNNESERRLRMAVVGRKNYYGSGSIWSGHLTAVLFTIIQTFLLNHIDPQKFLLDYFEVCARNGGRAPENVEAFMPWNLSGEQKAAWRYPEHPT